MKSKYIPVVKKFLKRVINSGDHHKEPLIVAIDPGAHGAIAFRCGKHYTVIDIPSMKIKKGKGNRTVFDRPLILRIFKMVKKMGNSWHSLHAVVEQPPPKGASAFGQFHIGCSYAMWPMFLMAMGFTVDDPMASPWKRVMRLNSNKENSRYTAMKMFPKADLKLKCNHDRAEALLLSEYHRRNLR